MKFPKLFKGKSEEKGKKEDKLPEIVETIPPDYPEQDHIPVVLLLDVSGSMEADNKIKKLNEGLKIFKTDVLGDDTARKAVDLAVVTFGKDVNIIHKFSPIERFNPPTLIADGQTPMGKAILMAIELVKQRKAEYRAQGIDYYRPWIFMITDGEPTDMQPGETSWNDVIKAVHEGASEVNKKFAFYAVGVEPANMAKLKQIAPPDITKDGKLYKFLWKLENKEGAFKDMFKFFSWSVTETAKAVPGIQEPMKAPESMKPT